MLRCFEVAWLPNLTYLDFQPVKDMPEKKKYGRLMKIGQYSSSPALDDDSIKHINFDCDTKYEFLN